MSKGTELCPWVTIHLPSILRQQRVARHDMSIFFPCVVVPVTRLRLWQYAKSPPATIRTSRASYPTGPSNDESTLLRVF